MKEKVPTSIFVRRNLYVEHNPGTGLKRQKHCTWDTETLASIVSYRPLLFRIFIYFTSLRKDRYLTESILFPSAVRRSGSRNSKLPLPAASFTNKNIIYWTDRGLQCLQERERERERAALEISPLGKNYCVNVPKLRSKTAAFLDWTW